MGRKPKQGSEPSIGTPRWKLRELRKLVYPTRKDAADALNFGDSTIGAYESGARAIPRLYAEKLTVKADVPIDWVYDGKPTPPPIAKGSAISPLGANRDAPLSVERMKRPSLHLNLVPYWGAVPAGNWQAPTDDTDWVQVSESVDTNGIIAVRVAGDSMEPRLHHGQLLCIKLSKELRDGVITLAKNQDSELTLKVPKYTPDHGWELQSINPDYGTVTAEYIEAIGYVVSVEETNPHGIRP